MTTPAAPGQAGNTPPVPARPSRSRRRRSRRNQAALARALFAPLLGVAGLAGVLILVLMMITALAPAPCRPDPPDSAGGLTSALHATLGSYLAWRPLVPGAAASVTAPGVHAEVAVGRRSLPAFLPGQRLSPRDPFRSASVTKTFTAAAVLRLTETGALTLDDPIARYLPGDLVDRLHVRDVAGTKVSSGRRITVHLLLNHTSGVRDYGTDPVWLARVAAAPHLVWTPHELVEHAIAAGEPYADPGREFHYSDTGYLLLAMILERVTARPLAEAYRALLPMHLLPATWLEGREPPPPGAGARASQYVGPLDLADHHPSYDTFGGGGLVTTVADLDAFARALFTGVVFTRPGTLTAMLLTVPDGSGDAYGLGIGRRTLAGETVWLHTGFLGGALAYVPRLRLSVGVTTNQTLAAPGPLLAAAIELARPWLPQPPRQRPDPPGDSAPRLQPLSARRDLRLGADEQHELGAVAGREVLSPGDAGSVAVQRAHRHRRIRCAIGEQHPAGALGHGDVQRQLAPGGRHTAHRRGRTVDRAVVDRVGQLHHLHVDAGIGQLATGVLRHLPGGIGGDRLGTQPGLEGDVLEVHLAAPGHDGVGQDGAESDDEREPAPSAPAATLTRDRVAPVGDPFICRNAATHAVTSGRSPAGRAPGHRPPEAQRSSSASPPPPGG